MDWKVEVDLIQRSLSELLPSSVEKSESGTVSLFESTCIIKNKAVLVFNRHYVDAHFCYKELAIQLAKNGFNVELYYLKGDQDAYFDPSLSIRVIRYGQSLLDLMTFLWRLFLSLWNAKVVIATPQYALHWVNRLNWIRKSKFVCLSDEVYTDDQEGFSAEQKLLENYQSKWRKREIKAHQSADATIALGQDRFELVRNYNSLTDLHRCFIVPNAPTWEGRLDKNLRRYYREHFKLDDERLIMLHSGGLKWDLMDELFKISFRNPMTKVIIQARINNREVRSELSDSVLLSDRFFPYEELVSLTSGADIGLLLYNEDNPEERRNGPTAGKLGLYLAAGLPLIACNLRSFEWIEKEGCGIVIQNLGQLEAAAEHIRLRYSIYQSNSQRVFKAKYEYSSNIEPFIEWLKE